MDAWLLLYCRKLQLLCLHLTSLCSAHAAGG